MKKNDIENNLKKRIKELEAENKKLKSEIKKLKSDKNVFYTLKDQLSDSVDLGIITKPLPPFIPDHKKWKATDYPKEWEPKKKAEEYLLAFWKNYPVTQSYFSNIKGGQSFYKYLKRNNLFKLLPNSFQLQLKKKIELEASFI